VPGKDKGKIPTALPKARAQREQSARKNKRDRSSNPALRINQRREGQGTACLVRDTKAGAPGTHEYREGWESRGTRLAEGYSVLTNLLTAEGLHRTVSLQSNKMLAFLYCFWTI
jgi:hypothetical protein